MLVTVKGKQLDVGDALRGHVETALAAAVGKYFGNALESHVVMTREAHLFRADVSVHVGRDILVQGQGSAVEAYAAADQAIERVAKRLRRYKRRLRDHHNRDKGEILPAQAGQAFEGRVDVEEAVVAGSAAAVVEQLMDS